tara:strand:- start:20014 stop:20454 length:441 start_codon:yes stop_codon:yes gene_type:complete
MNLWRLINPIVALVLKSKLHFIFSHQLLLFRITGRRSGKIYQIPASYAVFDDRIHCITLRSNQWWKNFINLSSQEVYFKGQLITMSIEIDASNDVNVETKLRQLIEHNPIDAFFAKVKLDKNKKPIKEDLEQAAKLHTSITLNLQE